MRLEELYRIRFTYPEGWVVGLEGVGAAPVSRRGSLRGFDHWSLSRRQLSASPHRVRTFLSRLRAAIDTDDGATIMVEMHGYGRAYPAGRRQIVGSVLHVSDSDRYRGLNDVVCACAGEVRAPEDPNAQSSVLVIDVAELVWEPIG
jgi:hypothetical protein